MGIHIESLHDSDIDALLDRHVFQREQWCNGYSNRDGACIQCGAVDDWPAFRRSTQHPRRVPVYHVEDIIEAMTARSQRALFARLVLVAIGRRNEAILQLSRRVVAIAALQSVGIIGPDGSVAGRQSEEVEAIHA